MADTINYGGYNVTTISAYEIQVCFGEKYYYYPPYDTYWHIEETLHRHLPILAMQLGIAIFILRFLLTVLKPLHQPRFVAEVAASILLGPTVFRMFNNGELEVEFFKRFFPFENTMLLESFSNLGLTYYMFLVGLEMDLSTVRHMGKNSWSIAIAGILFPFFVGTFLYFLPILDNSNQDIAPIGALFWAITLTITSFPDLARILSDFKLLHTELGRIALSSTLINDISTWIFLVAVITIQDENGYRVALSILPIIGLIVICWFVVRPSIAWMIKRTKKKGGRLSDTHVHFILLGVALCGATADACGSHSLVGGYIFGLIIPKGELAIKIMERSEEFVTGIMLPSFIISCGLKTNFVILGIETKWKTLVVIITVATSAKIASTLFVSLYFGMSLRDGLTLGGLMNTKGFLSLVILNEGRNVKALDNISMGIMMLTILFMTGLVGPIVFLVNSTKRSKQNKPRSIQGSNPNTELRILTCIHSVPNIPSIINLLQASNATRRSPICVFAVHLVKLTRTAPSAMLIVHDTPKNTPDRYSTRGKIESESDHIITAFENYKKGNDSVSVHPLTAMSPYTTMHEDIFKLADDKAVTMILIPFHKQLTADGGLPGDNHPIREVHKNLLVKALCSVGILVDRGLGLSTRLDLNSGRRELRFAMFFIGGPDDHEALSYAWRMAGTPDISLTVVRFQLGRDAEVDAVPEMKDEIKDEFDNEYINEFRFQTMCDQSITYNEKLVNDCNELVESIRTMYNNFDLYIVGRGRGVKSPLLKELITDCSDSPELGPIGEILVSSKFTANASVLVVQQSALGGLGARLQHHKRKFVEKKWASPILNPDYKAIVNQNVKDSQSDGLFNFIK